jgi:hypothetical protein
MENTRIHKQIKEIYTDAHRQLCHAMNLEAGAMSIYEAGQLYKMIDRDVQVLYKRIEYLSLGDKQ